MVSILILFKTIEQLNIFNNLDYIKGSYDRIENEQ